MTLGSGQELSLGCQHGAMLIQESVSPWGPGDASPLGTRKPHICVWPAICWWLPGWGYVMWLIEQKESLPFRETGVWWGACSLEERALG